MKSIVIHGPQGSGKTRGAALFKKYYKCVRLVDNWKFGDPLNPGELALTSETPPEILPAGLDMVIHVDDAFLAIQL